MSSSVPLPLLDKLSSFVEDTAREHIALLARILELEDQVEIATGAAKLNAETIQRQQREHGKERGRLYYQIRGLEKQLATMTDGRDKYLAQVRTLQDALGTLTRAKEGVDAMGRDRITRERDERYDSD